MFTFLTVNQQTADLENFFNSLDVVLCNVHFTYLVNIGFFKTFQSLNPGRAIAEIKKLLAGIAEKGNPGLEGTAGEDFFI